MTAKNLQGRLILTKPHQAELRQYWQNLDKSAKLKIAELCHCKYDYIRQVFLNSILVSAKTAVLLETATQNKFPRTFWRPDLFQPVQPIVDNAA